MKKEEALKVAEELFFEEFYKEEKDGTEIVSSITLYQDIQIMKMDIKKMDGYEDYPPHFIVALPTPNNTKILPEWGNALISDAYGTFEGSGIPVFEKLHGALMFIDFYKPFIKQKPNG